MKGFFHTRITDGRGDAFMGDEPYRLLLLIAEHGSILHASKKLHVSYVNALRMLDRMDAALGSPVARRRAGGTLGGGTRLTPFGHRVLKAYGAYQRSVRRFADRHFRKLARAWAHARS